MSPPRTYPPGVACCIDLEPAGADAAVASFTELFGWVGAPMAEGGTMVRVPG